MSKKILGLVAAFVFAAVGAQSLMAQEVNSNGTPVQMVVTVEAHKGSDVPAVSSNDVMVREGKTQDQVTGWVPAQGQNAGLELFVLIDDSSARNVDLQFSDVKKFIDAQPASTLIGVAYMQNGTARIEQSLTNDHEAAKKALRIPLGMRGVNSSPYFAFSDLMKRWRESKNRRDVLMITDGIDLYYGVGDLQDPYLDSAIDAALKGGVQVSAIYNPDVGHFGHSYWLAYWGQMYLAEIAERTGGEAYSIGMSGPPVEFAPFLSDLANRLNHQYILTFVAKPEKKAGLRNVKVATEVKNAQLVSAQQVYVPATPE